MGTATVYAVYLAAVTLAVTILTAFSGWWAKGRAAARDNLQAKISEAADRLAKVKGSACRVEGRSGRSRFAAVFDKIGAEATRKVTC